jgi:UDP-2-acetamido-3-amino-2,3-dideoxy-glucuronate N-acetyltransferase
MPNIMEKFFCHKSSFIDEGAVVGEGTKIWHFSHIMSGAKIGQNCNIGQNVVVSPDCIIGNNVKIQNNVSIYTGVIIEDDVFLGPSMVFTNVINPRSQINRRDEFMTTLVKHGVTIGANATIVCGSTLEKFSFIGAGSVVTKDVPAFALVYGNPAKIRGWMCQCGIKLTFNRNNIDEIVTCSECGAQYLKSGEIIQQTGSLK